MQSAYTARLSRSLIGDVGELWLNSWMDRDVTRWVGLGHGHIVLKGSGYHLKIRILVLLPITFNSAFFTPLHCQHQNNSQSC